MDVTPKDQVYRSTLFCTKCAESAPCIMKKSNFTEIASPGGEYPDSDQGIEGGNDERRTVYPREVNIDTTPYRSENDWPEGRSSCVRGGREARLSPWRRCDSNTAPRPRLSASSSIAPPRSRAERCSAVFMGAAGMEL
ncbi:hypothetical protein EYF80_061462 [Liparis tanakae]|uniref:Uncharacterized protein n=1 Tax=Liparis tanakae TaxID=230148 RepID=A0A4Z2EIK5_9TELE|nr:hypothetical protein EYF80_061462 [Liparis tanakae]